MNLVKYDTACRALAEAKAVDEVKDIRDQAVALETYAQQAKNLQLELDAVQIRIRAERRLGEMIQTQRETVGLSKGAAESGVVRKQRGVTLTPRSKPTLADAGIAKELAKRARKMAAIPEEKFKAKLTEAFERDIAVPAGSSFGYLDAGDFTADPVHVGFKRRVFL